MLSDHEWKLGATALVVAAALLTTFLVVAGAPGSALVVAASTWLMIWAVRRHSSSINRRSP